MIVNQAQATSDPALKMTRDTVIIDWQLSSYFGWGVYGINLMVNWQRQHRLGLATSMPVDEASIDLNPIEWTVIDPVLQRSRELQKQLEPFVGKTVAVDLPVLHALGNDFKVYPSTDGVRLEGKPSIGVTFFEFSDFGRERRERAATFPLLVTGSTWNRTLLDDAGIGPTALVMQGVDPTIFHPAPKAGWFAGRFTIFSGGKLEYRKGQDLVLKAFRAFVGRHPDALLITAWSSPWPSLALSINSDPTLVPIGLGADGQLDIEAWAYANGIAPGKIIDLGPLPNSAMPRLYREMDVALFPNRCEGGTNLVAMECMASGVPVILSRNTGHVDLIAPDRCFALDKQSPVAGDKHRGWGESDIEEIVETLEAAYRDPANALARAERGVEFMRTMTWTETVRQLTSTITPYI